MPHPAKAERSAPERMQKRFVTRVSLGALLWSVVVVASAVGIVVLLGAHDQAIRGAIRPMILAILAIGVAMAIPGAWLGWVLTRRIDDGVAASLETDGQPADSASAWHTIVKDPMTGLFSRNALLVFADDSVPYFKRYRRSVSILMVEIDHFQTIMDTHRLSGGDDFIRHIADILDLSVRKTDKVARFDPRRFIILAYEMSDADTLELANRICASVSDLALTQGTRVIPITVSIGATTVSDGDSGSATLLERAERAIAAAKGAGGHRAVFLAASSTKTLEKAA